jgi:tRNA uridine 5-carboxymethylaminomethyl modification enzyme
LSGCLARLGLELGRLKTGTPPRLQKAVDRLSAIRTQPGDEEPAPFSYLNEYPVGPGSPPLTQVQCWIGAPPTKKSTRSSARICIARRCTAGRSIHRPALLPEHRRQSRALRRQDQHQIFLEPEGLDTDEIYCNGISTSLPAMCRSRSSA